MILINGKNDSSYSDIDLEDILDEQEFTLTLSEAQIKRVSEFVEDIKTRTVEIVNARHSTCDCVRPIFTIVVRNGALVIRDNMVKNIDKDNNKVTYRLGAIKTFHPERKDLNSCAVIDIHTSEFRTVDYKVVIRD